MSSGIILPGIIQGFLTHNSRINLLKIWYVLELIKLCNVSKFHQISFSGMINIMGQLTLMFLMKKSEYLECIGSALALHTKKGIFN